jgi:hypothetical protein
VFVPPEKKKGTTGKSQQAAAITSFRMPTRCHVGTTFIQGPMEGAISISSKHHPDFMKQLEVHPIHSNKNNSKSLVLFKLKTQ